MTYKELQKEYVLGQENPPKSLGLKSSFEHINYF